MNTYLKYQYQTLFIRISYEQATTNKKIHGKVKIKALRLIKYSFPHLNIHSDPKTLGITSPINNLTQKNAD